MHVIYNIIMMTKVYFLNNVIYSRRALRIQIESLSLSISRRWPALENIQIFHSFHFFAFIVPRFFLSQSLSAAKYTVFECSFKWYFVLTSINSVFGVADRVLRENFLWTSHHLNFVTVKFYRVQIILCTLNLIIYLFFII